VIFNLCLAMNLRWLSVESGLQPSTVALSFSKPLSPAVKSQASTVQPGVSSLG
jgi:hypothetical protein